MHLRRPTTIPRRKLPDLRAALALALAVTAAVLTCAAAAAAQPSAPAKTRVTVIGDSITASFNYVVSAKRYLGKGLDLRSDALVCRTARCGELLVPGHDPADGAPGRRRAGPCARPGRRHQRRLQRLGGRVRRRPRDEGAQDGGRQARDLGHACARRARTRRSTRSRTRASAALASGGGAGSSSPTGTRTAAGSRGSARTACT